MLRGKEFNMIRDTTDKHLQRTRSAITHECNPAEDGCACYGETRRPWPYRKHDESQDRNEYSDFRGMYGTVYLRDYMVQRDGASYLGLTGRIHVIPDKEAYGFAVRNTDSNYVVAVEGTTETVVVLGCQIRGAIFHEPDVAATKIFYVVP